MAPKQQHSLCIPKLLVERRRCLQSAEMAAAYPRAHHSVGAGCERRSWSLPKAPTPEEVEVRGTRAARRKGESFQRFWPTPI